MFGEPKHQPGSGRQQDDTGSDGLLAAARNLARFHREHLPKSGNVDELVDRLVEADAR